MTPRELINIHTIRNSCRDTLPCAIMVLKLPWYFYMLMEEPLGCYFQVQSPYYQEAQCKQKTPIPVSLKWQLRSEKTKKGQASTLITATTSIHLPKPVSTDLTIKPDSLSTKPIGRWHAKLINVKHLPHKAFFLWHHHYKGDQPRLKRHLLPMR